MDTKKGPKKWLCVVIGILLFAIIPPFTLGYFHLDQSIITRTGYSLWLAGAGAGWLYWKVRQP